MPMLLLLPNPRLSGERSSITFGANWMADASFGSLGVESTMTIVTGTVDFSNDLTHSAVSADPRKLTDMTQVFSDKRFSRNRFA